MSKAHKNGFTQNNEARKTCKQLCRVDVVYEQNNFGVLCVCV